MMTSFPTPTQRQFITFLFVGGFNTIVAYSLFALFIYLNLHYTLAVLFSTCLGILINFNTTGRIVFKNKNKRLLFHFIKIYFILYFINISLIKLIHQSIPNLYLTGAIASLLMAGLAFYLNKRFVFERR